jgi:hypothetical protein
MSLEDTVRVLILSEGLEWILRVQASRLVSTREKIITDEMVEEKIKELRPHHPVFAAILQRVHEMNLKETAFKNPRCSARDFLERKRLYSHSIHFPSLTESGFFTMKVRFTDSLALPVDTDGVDQLTLIPPLTGVL